MWGWLTGSDASDGLDETLRQVYLEASNLLEHGEAEAANREFRRLVRERPSFAPGWFGLAKSCVQLQDMDGAVAGFRKAARLDPGSWSVHHALGNALQETGQLREAEKCFRRAVSLAPDERAPLLALALHLAAASRLPEARRQLEAAMSRAEGHVRDHEILAWLGAVCGDLGDVEAAEKAFSTACLVAPDSPEVYELWASFAYDREEWAEAERLARRAVALAPALERARVILVHAALRAENRDKAAQYVEELLAAGQPGGLGHALQARVRFESGQVAEAVEAGLAVLRGTGVSPMAKDLALECLRAARGESVECDRFVVTLRATRDEGVYYRTFGILAPEEPVAVAIAGEMQEAIDPGPWEAEEVERRRFGQVSEVGVYEVSLARHLIGSAAGASQ